MNSQASRQPGSASAAARHRSHKRAGCKTEVHLRYPFFFPFFLLARLSHPSPNSQNLTVDRDRVRFIGRVGPPPRGVPRDQAVVWLGMVSAGAVSRSRSYDAWGRRPSLSNAR